MKLNNDYSYRPDEERLSNIEEIWGVRLPEEIRTSLMIDNGGVPEKRNFQCGKRTRMIVRFLCIKEKILMKIMHIMILMLFLHK